MEGSGCNFRDASVGRNDGVFASCDQGCGALVDNAVSSAVGIIGVRIDDLDLLQRCGAGSDAKADRLYGRGDGQTAEASGFEKA